MEITKHSDITLILKLEDYKGVPMRVADCADIRVYVWTANRNNFLQFTKRDIKQKKEFDEIPIPSFMMNCLESGVICMQYRYAKFDDNYEMSDSHYDKSKIVTTDIYFRNCNFNEIPANPVNYETLNYLTNKIEKIGLDSEAEIAKLKAYVENDFTDKLNAEIKRSNDVDVEMYNQLKSLKEDSAASNTTTNDKLDAEIKRSTDMDIELYNSIKQETERAKKAEKDLTDSHNELTTAVVTMVNDVNDSINKEADRAKKAESELKDLITSKGNENDAVMNNLQTAILNETSRATAAEKALSDSIDSNNERAKAVETILNTSLNSEVQRATDAENALKTLIQSNTDAINAEKQRSADKDLEHTNALNAETTRATAKENEIATNLQTEIQRATDREEHINDDLHAEIDRAKAEEARIEALITSNADADAEVKAAIENEVLRATTKENEIAAKVDANTTSISNEIDRATAAETTIANDLATEVSRAKAEEERIASLITDNANADTALKNDLTAEIARATSEEARIENITTVNAGNISSEIARAKQVEADITTSLQALKTTVQTNNAELTGSVSDLQTALQAEVSRSTIKDAEIDGKLDIINGDSTVIGSIAHSLSDSKHYTDDEIVKLKSSMATDVEAQLKDYATKVEVDDRIKGIIGTAPEALDTLGEIADRLSVDSDAINAINGVLTGKANASDVYSKNEIDIKVTGINNSISTETTRATNAETTIANDLQTEVSRATAKETAIENKVDANTTNITNEVTRAKAEEARIEALVSSNSDKYAEVKTSIEAEVTRATTKETEISNSLATETTRATTEEARIEGKVNANATNIEAEVSRATAAETTIANDLTTETNRAKAEEARIEALITSNADADAEVKAAIEAEVLRATTEETTLNNAISTEVSRATAAEKVNSDAIAILNGDSTVIGSVAHAMSDANHYTDDEIAKIKSSMNADYATKAEVTTALDLKADKATTYNKTEVDTLLDGKANTTDIPDVSIYATTENVNASLALKADKADVYTKAEVDEAISNVDVTEQLADYATKVELTAVEAKIPVNVSELTNDAGYLTEHQDLTEYAKTADVNASLDLKADKTEIADMLTKTEAATTYATKVELQELDDELTNAIEEKVENYIDGASYDSATKRINFNHGDTVKAYIDATPFIKDGMIESVNISEGNLQITWNTDAGKDTTSIPLTDIFNPANYYNKAEVDAALALKANATDVYNKTEVDAALAGKANTTDIPDVSGFITSTDVETYTYDKATIDSKVAESGTFDASLYYNKTATDTLLADKADKTEIPDVSGFATKTEVSEVESTLQANINAKQDALTAGDNIAIVKDVETGVTTISADFEDYYTKEELNLVLSEKASLNQLEIGLSRKADVETTYNKTEVDTLLADKANTTDIPDVSGFAKTADVNTALALKADKTDIPTVPTNVSELVNDAGYLTEHQDLTDYVKTSETTAVKDADGNVITEIIISEPTDDDNIPEVYTKSEVDTLLADKADKVDVYTKAEVDEAISNIDVTTQLQDYAKTADVNTALALKADATDVYTKTEVDTTFAKIAETTAIKDSDGNIITEMIIDNSDDIDDSIEVYTKEQCDSRFVTSESVNTALETKANATDVYSKTEADSTFAKLWSGTQAEYDAIAEKDNNTLYIIQ